MAVQTTAPGRPDPVWFTAEAVEACEDAWSFLDKRPTPAVRRRRRRFWTVWITLSSLVFIGFMTLLLTTTDPLSLASQSQLLPFPLSAVVMFVGLCLMLAGLLANDSFSGFAFGRDGDATRALDRVWRKRVDRAVTAQEVLPFPWLRVVHGMATERGRPLGHVLQGIGWPVFYLGMAIMLGWPALYALYGVLGLALLARNAWDAVRAHRVRRYLGWLREHPVG